MDKFTQVDAGNWLSDSATIHGALGEDGSSYVVYAYAMDNAGNQSDYICTEGLVQDASAPVVTVTEPKKEDGTLKDRSERFSGWQALLHSKDKWCSR